MKNTKIGIFFLVIGSISVSVRQASADIYVSRIGDGSAYVNGGADASAAFIDKYSDAGALISSIPLPTATSGANHPLTLAALSTSNGHISLTTDGQYILIGGYDAPVGTATVRQTTTGRDIGLINVSTGAVDTTTSVADAYPGSSGNNNEVRDVVGPNGTQLYMTGSSFPSVISGTPPTSNGNGGLIYAGYQATSSAVVTFGPSNLRSGAIVNGDLYASSATTTTGVPHSFVGIAKMANGLPTPTLDGQSDADFQVLFSTAISGSGAASPYDFWFKDANTVYVADDRQARAGATQLGGGIQKWTFDGSSWSLAYILALPTDTDGMRGLTGTVVGGNAVLYGTTGNSTNFTTAPLLQTSLVSITDTGPSSTFTTLATSATNTIFRGVAFVAPPAGVTGDYNGNGVVDAADYVLWRNDPASFGGTPAGYDTWRSHFGNTSGSGAGLGAGAVPEPASAVLLLFGCAALGLRRRAA